MFKINDCLFPHFPRVTTSRSYLYIDTRVCLLLSYLFVLNLMNVLFLILKLIIWQ